MGERVTLRKSCDNDANEGKDKEPTDELQSDLIGSSPHLFRESLQEFGDGEFGYPKAGPGISRGFPPWGLDGTYKAAYMILDAKTNRLPISR